MVDIVACPICKKEFKRPLMDLKYNGIGFTTPGLGLLKCPFCGKIHRASEFVVVHPQ